TNTARVTIQDNDFYGTFQFSKGNYEVEENGGSVTITVLRNGGRAGAVSVDLVVSNMSATVGLDYNTNSVPRTLTFGPNEIVKTFTIPIIDEVPPLAEGLETIGVALRNPSGGAVLGYPSNARVSIIDDEET